jgi:hypothetical protein
MRAERILVKLDRFFRAIHSEVRCGGVVTVGHWF